MARFTPASSSPLLSAIIGAFKPRRFKLDAPDHSHTIRMNAFDIPVYAVHRTTRGFYAGAGPNFSVNLSGTNELSNGASGTHSYKFEGSPFEHKRADFGFNFMAGYQMDMQSSSVVSAGN